MGIKRAGPCKWCASCLHKCDGYCDIYKCVIIRPVSAARCAGYEQDPRYQEILHGRQRLRREEDPELKELFDEFIH